MIFCTVTTLNRIHTAKVMARSVKEHHPNAKVAVCIVEEQIPSQVRNCKHIDNIVLAKDLGDPHFYRHMFKYEIHEGVWSLKPWVIQYCLRNYPDDNKFIYLDTDICVYSSFQEVDHILVEKPIVLTPHITQPLVNSELQMYPLGIYNSGFLALKRGEETLQFLQWWTERLNRFCYVDKQLGTFGDQKWLDYTPIFFHTHILKHPGYNVAIWNRYYRKMERSNNSDILVNGHPLRFYHFSSYGKKNFQTFYKKKYPDSTHPIHHLLRQYMRELTDFGYNPSDTLPCSYEYYRNGELIDKKVRLTFRRNPERFAKIQNPFTMSNRTFLQHEQKEQKESAQDKQEKTQPKAGRKKRSLRNKKRKEGTRRS